MKVLVSYSQNFMGEIVDDEYITYVNNYDDISEIYEALYSDHCVIDVSVEEVKEWNACLEQILGEEND